MKKITITIVFIATNVAAYAQQELDKAYLKCLYKYSFLKDTIETKKDADDLLILQIGKNISKCYSYYSYQVDSLVKTPGYERAFWDNFKKTIDKEGASSSNYPHKRLKTYVYKNYPKDKMTVTDGISLEYFIYNDDLNSQRWQILDETKDILGYSCQKAVCDFRCRHYEAWFTSDIPISDGPWKFSGLPGLIMEVQDKGNQYAFTIVGIEKVMGESIVFSKSISQSEKYMKTTRKEFLKGLKRFFIDSGKFIEAETGIILGGSNSSQMMQYDLIERDYRD